MSEAIADGEDAVLRSVFLTFWQRSKSPTGCNNFSVYYPDVCLQLNMFRTFSRPSSGDQ